MLEEELWVTKPHTIPTWPTGLWTEVQREAKPGGSALLRCRKNALSQEREGKLEREKEKQSEELFQLFLVRRDETLNSITNILSSGLQTPLVTLLSSSLSLSSYSVK